MQLPCSPALAFLDRWPPPPLATIHGSFASPGTRQRRKNGIKASFICIFPVGAPLVIPGSARWRRTAAAQHSGAQQLSCSVRDRAPRGCQGSSSVSAGGRQLAAYQLLDGCRGCCTRKDEEVPLYLSCAASVGPPCWLAARAPKNHLTAMSHEASSWCLLAGCVPAHFQSTSCQRSISTNRPQLYPKRHQVGFRQQALVASSCWNAVGSHVDGSSPNRVVCID